MHIKTVRLLGKTLKERQDELDQLEQTSQATLALCFGTVAAIEQMPHFSGLNNIAKQWLAGSSCLGCADNFGLNTGSELAATLLLIYDDTGHYGVGSANVTGDIVNQASIAVQNAMDAANKSYELPTLIWCLQAPGNEELVLEGIQNVVGTNVPILGGSSADNDVSGKWLQFDGVSLQENSMIVAVFYPSTPISSFFSSGYSATAFSGEVTKVENRQLFCINNQPAATVYNGWLTEAGAAALAPGNILMASTFFPLGREVKHHQALPIHLLSHPCSLNDDGSLSLFSEVKLGEKIWLMQGDKAQLIARAGEVVKTAKESLKFQYDCPPSGAIIVYCAGCMLAVQAELSEVQQAIKAELGDIPFIVTFTFGEQGCFIDGSNRHGNLMISAVLFGAK